MFYAAPFGIGNREEYARVVGFFEDAGGGSYRQSTTLLKLVYHLHRFALPSVRYALYPRRLHVASLDIRRLAHSLPSRPTSAIVPRYIWRMMWGWTKGHPWQKDAPSRESGTLRYDLEMESRKLGWGDPALLYGEDNGLSRFRDGRCTFSRVHADWALLRKRDQTKER